MRIRDLLLAAAILSLTGCTPDEGARPTQPTRLVDTGWSLLSDLRVDSLKPARYTTDANISLTLSCPCRYSGVGRVWIGGYGGSQEVARLLPADVSIGFYEYRVEFEPGRLTIPLALKMTSTMPEPLLDFHVTLDSLRVDGTLFEWTAPEARAVWQPDLPCDCCAFLSNGAFLEVTIPRAE